MQLQFIWTPFDSQEIRAATPDWVYQESHLWTSVTSLLCFPTVEWHQVDRVLRQFGAQQPIPGEPLNIDGLIGKDARGQSPWWPGYYRVWYNLWAIRHERCIAVQHWPGGVQVPSVEYWAWYTDVARRVLTPSIPHHAYIPPDAPVHIPMVHVPQRPDHVPDRRRADRRARVGTRIMRRQPRQESPDDDEGFDGGDDDHGGDDGGPGGRGGHGGEPSTQLDLGGSSYHRGESSTQPEHGGSGYHTGQTSTQTDYQFQPQFHIGESSSYMGGQLGLETDLLHQVDPDEDMSWSELYRMIGLSPEDIASPRRLDAHGPHAFDLNAPPSQPSLSPPRGSSPHHVGTIPSFDLLGGTPPSGRLQQDPEEQQAEQEQAEEQQPEQQQHEHQPPGRPVRDIRPRRCYTGGHIGAPMRRRRDR